MKAVFKLLRYSGLPLLMREVVQRKRITILLLHDPSPADAQTSFQYLKSRYNVISLQQLLEALEAPSTHQLPSKALVITFDDGHLGNYELLPVLKELQLPVTIFLCSGIVGTNRGYWFKHLGREIPLVELKSVANSARLARLAELGFNQDQALESREALSKAEIDGMLPFVDFQAHTVFHPCLPTCNDQEASREIIGSKEELETKFGLNINAFSYPNGDYSERDVQLTKAAGYKMAVTVDVGYNTLNSDPFRLKRISVNDTGDINELSVKASGLWAILKFKLFGTQPFGLMDVISEEV